MRNRRGFGLVDVLVALVLLVLVMIPLMELAIGCARQGAWGWSRLVMELRARRLLAEPSTSSYEALSLGAVAPELGEPGDDQTYTGLIAGSKGAVDSVEVAPGLMKLTATVDWQDPATHRAGPRITAARLKVRSTLSLEARFPMAAAR